jgi:hypothetical protein
MNYLAPAEYELFALDDTTPSAIVAAASALIDAHCNRPTLAVASFTERLRTSPANTVRLTYLPLTTAVAPSDDDTAQHPPDAAGTPFTTARVRYASTARACNAAGGDLALAVAQAFALPGAWTDIDPASLDFDANTGEVTLPANVLGLPYAEAEFTYNAGFSAIPDAVKHACAHIIRSALAQPALNVRASSIERLHMEYFAESLLSPDVRKLLAPFVARRA